MPLGPHDFCARVPELEPRRRVDGVVDAAVAGGEAAQQSGIICIHNGVRPQPGDVPLPEHQAGISCSGRQGIPVHHALFLPLGGEQGILDFQKFGGQGHGRPDIHQGAEQPPL